MNRYPLSLEFYYDEPSNSIIISNPKIASTYLKNNFNSGQFISADIDFNNGNVVGHHHYEINSGKIIKKWESYLKNEDSKPNIIVLYREPYKRFITAFIEDFIHIDSEYFNLPTYNVFLETFYWDNGFKVKKFNKHFFNILDKISRGEYPPMSKANRKRTLTAFESYVKLMMRWKLHPDNVYKGHNIIHNTLICNLLNNNILSKDKTIFYNLDDKKEELKIFLIKNGIEVKFDEISSNGNWSITLKEVIEKNNLKPNILESINKEIKSYKLLETYRNFNLI